MVDSILLRGVLAQGDITRAPKEALLIATSTKEASCTPTSTPSSQHFTCVLTISCPHGRDRAVRSRSPTLSSSRWPSRRCFSRCPTTASSSRSPGGVWDICFRICPSSRATTSACARWHPRSPGCFWSWRPTRRRSVTACGCSTAPRCRAANRGRPRVAATLPARQAMAGARRTAAASGAFGSTCCAHPTAWRSPLSWPPPTSVSGSSPPRCSGASRWTATPFSPTRASPAKSSNRSSTVSARVCCAPTAEAKRTATDRSAPSVNGSNRCSGPAKASSPSKPTAAARPRACAPASHSDSSHSPRAWCTTNRSVTPAGTSPPTATGSESTI